MARFRATIQGQRGSASRLGGPKSGIHVRANGWDSGVWVTGNVNKEGQDVFQVYATGGSHDAVREKYLGKVILVDGKPEFVRPS